MVKILVFILTFITFSFAKEINIVATIKPLSDIAKEVVKNKAKTDYIIPANVSIHMYEYKMSDINKVRNADIFMYIGSGEPDINSLIKIPDRKALLNVSKIDGIFLIKQFEFEEDNHHEDEDETFHPALWLDPYNAKLIAKVVYERVSKLDPQNEEFYKKNYEEFSKKCDEIINYGQSKFSTLKNRYFISYHYAWPYFTKRFKLNYVGVIELGHGREPTIKHLLKIVNLIKEKNIKSIFAAKQFYNPNYAKLVKDQTGVNIVFLDPFGINMDYIQMIKFNIDKIYEGIE
jgi:zinc transport system substrate-binding protein